VTGPLLLVDDLRVSFRTTDGIVHAVDGISYTVEAGKTLGIVGESGSGKTVSSLTALGLTRTSNATVSGRIMFDGQDMVTLPDEKLRSVRGNDVAMIFQDPLSALHPFYKVGSQLIEAMQAHGRVSRPAARARAAELLDLVGIPDPKRRLDQYPHEFSGGMRQRAMIAMALSNEPKLLIADEPTTALDVTVQAQILALLEELQSRLGTAIIIITHDLGVVAEIADDICVMYAGRIVERGSTEDIFYSPQHPYTWGLLSSIPRLDNPRDEELVPIAGRPPSLINRPSGCHFHPRCPYVRDAHKRVDPKLLPVDGSSEHMVACLLESSVRSRIWQGIQTGRDRDSLQRMAASSPEPEVPAAAMDEPETEGTAIEPMEEGLVESERPGEHPPRQPIDGPEHSSRRPPGGDISGGTGGI
jgi:peptide/nickel transport system ATP-binding protein